MKTNTRMSVVNEKSMTSQNGSTFLGNLIVVAAIGIFGLVGMKLFPAYSEFYSVKSVLKAMKDEPLNTMGKSEIKASFDRRASTAYVSTVTAEQLKIEKEGRDTVVSVNYQVVKPIIANISVMAEFTASTRDQ
jgi:hypothetical protein